MSRMLKDKSISSIVDYYYNDYQKVERIYPHNSNAFTNLYNLTYEPTHIIDNIYLGNAYNASNYNNLKYKNIKLIINVTEEIPNYYNDYNDFEYYNIQIKDLNSNHITQYINNTIVKIRKFYTDNKANDTNNIQNTLVHCFMGSSRSATIVIAYLSKYHNMTIEKAIEYCKMKRFIVNINTTFREDLIIWYNLENSKNN